MFLVPSALVSAELAAAWPGRGGVYVWIKEALGGRWGFLAIWLQFLVNIVNELISIEVCLTSLSASRIILHRPRP